MLTLTTMIAAFPLVLLGLVGGVWLFKKASVKETVPEHDLTLARFAAAERLLDAGHCRFAFPGGGGEWSAGMFRLAGLEDSQRPLNYQEFLATVHADDKAPVRQDMDAAAREAKACAHEFRIIRPDGDVRRLRAVVHPESNESGPVENIICAFQDVSGRGQDVENLSLELDAAKFALTEAQLESRAKSDFLALMSHELRTPLNAIQGFADIMNSELYGPIGSQHYGEYVHNIRQAGGHLLAIVNDILDLSKVEAGRMEINPEPVDLAEVIVATQALLRERAKSLGITLKVSLPEDLAPLNADERMVKQMLINLISNALDHTPSEGWVGVTAEHDAGGGLILAVSDTGEGIAPEDLSRAVLPFQSISGPIGESDGKPGLGTGLGLPLVRSLIELHGGVFSIKSTPGVGTTVTLRFPAYRVMGSEAIAGQGDL